jgi:thioredoxin-like negative regulator of GroEL
MKTWIIFCLLVLSFCADENQKKPEQASKGVIFDIQEDSFIDALKYEKYFVVNFYSTTCEHCKVFEPIYEEASDLAKERGVPFRFTKLNGPDEGKRFIREYNIKTLPGVIAFIDGYPIPYQGERLASELVNFLSERAKAKVDLLLSERDVKMIKYKRGNRVRFHFLKIIGHPHKR